MKKWILVSFFASATAFALGAEDPITSIGRGSQFVNVSDIYLLANESTMDLASHRAENKAQTCVLYFQKSPKERVLRLGSTLTVEKVESQRDGFWNKDGRSAVIYFAHPVIQALKCFSGERLGDDYSIPTLQEMEQTLSSRLQFNQAPPVQIPSGAGE